VPTIDDLLAQSTPAELDAVRARREAEHWREVVAERAAEVERRERRALWAELNAARPGLPLPAEPPAPRRTAPIERTGPVPLWGPVPAPQRPPRRGLRRGR
jgi:hypothetical protein